MDNNSPSCKKCGHDCCWGQEFDNEQEYMVCGHCGERYKVKYVSKLMNPKDITKKALAILKSNLIHQFNEEVK